MKIFSPKTINEIPGVLAQMTRQSKFIGGGTDLIIRLQSGTDQPDALCYLGYIDEMKKIQKMEDSVVIGAYATMTQIQNHPLIREKFPALVDSASDVGSLQVRNNGTIGGNIGNASPAGDLLPVLYLYNAKIGILGPKGVRSAPIQEIIVSPGKTSLAFNEAITQIILPVPNFNSGFAKLGSRKKVTISRISIAWGILEENHIIKEAQIYIGAISIKPVKLAQAENYLIGKTLNENSLLKVSQFLSDLIMEITPKEYDRDYKVYAAKGIVFDAFRKLKNESLSQSAQRGFFHT